MVAAHCNLYLGLFLGIIRISTDPGCPGCDGEKAIIE